MNNENKENYKKELLQICLDGIEDLNALHSMFPQFMDYKKYYKEARQIVNSYKKQLKHIDPRDKTSISLLLQAIKINK